MGEETLGAKRIGRVIKVTMTDDSIGEVIEMGFNRIVIERSINLGVSWVEITRPEDRPVLEAGKVAYAWIDRSGDPAYLYRSRYIDTRTDEMGDPSEPIEGAGIEVASILPIPVLKQRYLFGVDFRDDNGALLPDAVFQFYILSAIATMERELDIPLLPTAYVERQDYYASDYPQYNFIQLDHYPVLSVDGFAVQYPTGQNVVTYPIEWLRVDPEKGHLRIVPTAGTLSQILINASGGFLPAIYSGIGNLPHLFEIQYTAGFAEGQIPPDILDVVGKLASLGPFNIFGDLIAGAGIANISLSMDGLSQSIGTTSSATNAGYGSRIIQYLKEIKDQVPKMRKYYKGIRMVTA